MPTVTAMLAAAILALLTLALSLSLARSELLGVILVSRHGNRAPVAQTSILCPANAKNIARYSQLRIASEGVTGRGQSQLLELGAWCRARYVDTGFLKSYYDNDQLYIRAVGEDRTLQSAVAWGQGLFPPGHGAIHYPVYLPPPLPVYTLPDELDSLLENRKAGCYQRLQRDIAEYDKTVSAIHWREHHRLLSSIESLCQADLTAVLRLMDSDHFNAIKNITDNFTFDFIEGFTLIDGLTVEHLLQLRKVVLSELRNRILGTAEQVTYMSGDLPLSMVESFGKLVEYHRHNVTADNGRVPLKFYSYHGHRELLYSLGEFFDIVFDIRYPSLPAGGVPSAASLVFELHYIHCNRRCRNHHRDCACDGSANDEDYEVRAILWTPCDDVGVMIKPLQEPPLFHIVNQTTHSHYSYESSVPVNVSYTTGRSHTLSHHQQHSSGSDTGGNRSMIVECGARLIDIGKCRGGRCSFRQFQRLVDDQLATTGDWRSLCKRTDGRETFVDIGTGRQATSQTETVVFYCLVSTVVMGALIFYCRIYRPRQRRAHYQRL